MHPTSLGSELRPATPSKYRIPDQIALAKQASGIIINDATTNPPLNPHEMDAVNSVLSDNNSRLVFNFILTKRFLKLILFFKSFFTTAFD